MSSETDTTGSRLYAIRLALGDGVRTALPMRDFVAYVEAETGVVYDKSVISLLERDKRPWKVEDVRVFAAVDPLRRGRTWLAFGVQDAAADELPDPRANENDNEKGA